MPTMSCSAPLALSKRGSTPPVSLVTTPLPFQALELGHVDADTSPVTTTIPRSAACWISSKRLAAVISALLGMQPTFRQTPPHVLLLDDRGS